MKKNYISAGDYLHDVWRLAATLRNSGWRPDLLIALWRGGAPVGVAVHEYFVASGWKVRHFPLKCASYVGIGRCSGRVEFTHAEAVFGEIRRGDRVLVVDDVFDTGTTAAAMRERVAESGADMRLACVYWKRGNCPAGMKPDWFVKDVGGDWIVFPHEIEGLTPDEIREKDPLLGELLG